MWSLPVDAAEIIQQLASSGYSAYAVGGCVRDSLLGQAPNDWDICTSATPDEMKAVFQRDHVVETGLQHGTLTVVRHHQPYEVTTFRTDGHYADHRHPDSVSFVRDVREDLARRDFTVNAMAWSPEQGLVDLFHGQEDLQNKVIRCVGDPRVRFEEDALRILRALRFASTYSFAIAPDTASAIHHMYPALSNIAHERIREELVRFLCGKGVAQLLREYADVIMYILPELKPCLGFQQHTQYHRYDVWEHTLRAVAAAPQDRVLRLTMLLHDSGKPACFTLDSRGIGHAYGHPTVSARLARQVMDRLRFDRKTADQVLLLVEEHDMDMSEEPRIMLRQLNKLGEKAMRQLIEVHRADALAKGFQPDSEINAWCDSLIAALDRVLEPDPCYTLDRLLINGNDLKALGYRGREIGAALSELLEQVISGDLPNQRDLLLSAAKNRLALSHRDGGELL